MKFCPRPKCVHSPFDRIHCAPSFCAIDVHTRPKHVKTKFYMGMWLWCSKWANVSVCLYVACIRYFYLVMLRGIWISSRNSKTSNVAKKLFVYKCRISEDVVYVKAHHEKLYAADIVGIIVCCYMDVLLIACLVDWLCDFFGIKGSQLMARCVHMCCVLYVN